MVKERRVCLITEVLGYVPQHKLRGSLRKRKNEKKGLDTLDGRNSAGSIVVRIFFAGCETDPLWDAGRPGRYKAVRKAFANQ